MDYSLPRLHTKFGERAFSHAGPSTWNALPDNIRTVADPVKFRQEGQHPLTGQRAANFRLLANQ